MDKKKISKLILKATDGVFQYLTDFTLYLAFSGFASFGKRFSSKDVWQIGEEAMEMLGKINYQKIKQNIYRLTAKGLIYMEKNKKEKAIKLTKKGKARLFGKIAKYKKQRNWDKKIYIITYDIPEKRRRDRNILRTYLNKLAAARLQKSVYFTPYNPSKILNEFIQERELHGTIIVSCIGKDGFIGGKDIKSLTRKLYKIDRLNEKYEKLIKEFKESKGKNKLKFNFNYLSLLKEDPQLPFELLPENFKGEKAYQLYLKNLSI